MGEAAVPTAELLDLLERHYRKPGADRDGEVLLREPAAPGTQRRADLVRIGLWRSRGTGIDVHELKVSRGDWRRELDDKGKAEAWWPYCSRFWIVAPSTDVVPPEELPPGWGLMTPPRTSRGRRFKVEVKATSKDPKLTVPLMMELVRRTDNARLGQIDELNRAHRADVDRQVAEALRLRAEQGLDYHTRHRLEALGKIEELLGVELTTYGGFGAVTDDSPQVDAEELASVLREFGRGHVSLQRAVELCRMRMQRALGGLSGAVEQLQQSMADLDTLEGKPE